MSRRTANGARTITTRGTVVLGEEKGEFDPVIHKDADPQYITDRKLMKMLCSMGSERNCKGCRLCAYGREYLKRKAGKKA